ncbi:Zinc finger protein [Beauveria bassiana D1-5]|uniref:Zinc finger protein n=1 Tax=Beauveria bassiana D1-5 TaxID=1245745 RepID=A0A0A2WFM5_BEABA|nr:Zinc finger protein [Beauveria bassiana D1-5]
MDSYSSYRDSRDSGRSPNVDRPSRLRDDSRGRDDRSDGFYRNRSPGNERRDRRRSRSPTDRYEPRARRDGRDRDDRRRGVSPPSNIDRYIPNQDSGPAGTLVNPVPNPAQLPYQVGFSFFSEWWRMNEKVKEEKERIRTGRRREPERPRGTRESQEEREKEKAQIQSAYDTYKEELQAKMARAFVSEHKKEQWFKERYVPEIRDNFRAKLNEIRRGAYSQWEQDLESGTFDEFSLEGIPKSESNGTGGVIEKEEGEATATNEILGVSDLVPANGADIRDENQFQPTLLIKTIAPHVSRQNLEEFCKEHLGEEEGGFRWLSLSDPNPSKRYHRIGWVMLHPSSESAMPVDRADPKDDDGEADATPPLASTAEKALEAVNGKTVKDEARGDFVCHVGVHNPPGNPRKKALWDLFSAPERIDKDLLLVQRLVNKYEEDFGSDFQAIIKVEEKVESLRNSGQLKPAIPPAPRKKSTKTQEVSMDEAMDGEDDGLAAGDDDDEGAVDEDEVDDEDMLVKKKQLDLLIEYLRRVFNFCFFCVFESDSIHELTRKCAGGHLRRPRSTLSISAREVAKASANGSPFPEKKRADGDEDLDMDNQENDKKFRNTSNKTEQQFMRAFNWVKTFEDKLQQILEPQASDLRKLGGRPVEEAVEAELMKHVKQEDEHKWRCKVPECSKLFKEEHFWKKHVEKRHTEWLDGLKEEFELINAYVLDPSHIAPSRTDANSNGHFPQPNGNSTAGTPRGFSLQNFSNPMMMPGFSAGGAPSGFPGMHGNGWNGMDHDRSGGPVRRGGMYNRGQHRTGPYDRRGGRSDGGRNRMGGSRWGDGAGAGAGGPREAVQGRSLKSYEDLDQVSGGGGGELNY